MARTDRLKKQHDVIVEMVQDISKSLNSPTVAANAQEIRLTLSKLAGVVNVHLAMEDKVLYPALMDSPKPNVKAAAKRYFDEMGGISQAFVDYNNQWTAQAIREQPDTFVRESASLFSVLGRRIEKENNELYVMADSL